MLLHVNVNHEMKVNSIKYSSSINNTIMMGNKWDIICTKFVSSKFLSLSLLSCSTVVVKNVVYRTVEQAGGVFSPSGLDMLCGSLIISVLYNLLVV